MSKRWLGQLVVMSWECAYEGCDELLNDDQHTFRRHFCDKHQKVRHLDMVIKNQVLMNKKKKVIKNHRQANTVRIWKREALLYLLKTNKKVSMGECHAFANIRKDANSVPTLIHYFRRKGHRIFWRYPYYYYEGKVI